MAEFVLIPGAWLGAWVWDEVTRRLEQKGHSTYPITLTGMGELARLAKDASMETATMDVLGVIESRALDDFVLVGHSFAGKVAAVVADRAHEKVRKVIYVDAFRPEAVRGPQGGFDPTREFGAPPPGAQAIPLTEEIVHRIGRDVKGSDRRRLLSMATPWPVRLAEDPIELSENYDKTKEAYVFCTLSGDPVEEIIAGKWGRLNGEYRAIEAGHWPMITRPEELADDLASLAE